MSRTKKTLPSETRRTRLIEEIASVLPRHGVPPEARRAALTLIGWLARRWPHDTSPPDGMVPNRRDWRSGD